MVHWHQMNGLMPGLIWASQRSTVLTARSLSPQHGINRLPKPSVAVDVYSNCAAARPPSRPCHNNNHLRLVVPLFAIVDASRSTPLLPQSRRPVIKIAFEAAVAVTRIQGSLVAGEFCIPGEVEHSCTGRLATNALPRRVKLGCRSSTNRELHSRGLLGSFYIIARLKANSLPERKSSSSQRNFERSVTGQCEQKWIFQDWHY